jgi:formylglycine-generating enzyme required for sulfatase activity
MDRWDESAYRRRVDGMTAEETFQLTQQHGREELRVLRGGSWFDTAVYCRAAYRLRNGAVYSFGLNGLRACLVPSPVQQVS